MNSSPKPHKRLTISRKKANFILAYALSAVLVLAIGIAERVFDSWPIPFAQVWKLPILLYLLVAYCFSKRTLFSDVGMGIMAESWLNRDLLANPVQTISNSTKILPLGLFLSFFNLKASDKKWNLPLLLFCFAQIISLVTIPYLLGILDSSDNYDLSIYGIEELTTFTACFGNSHPASSYFCAAALVLIWGLRKGHFKTAAGKVYNVMLVAVLLIALLKSYVRTGWLMFIVGTMIILSPNKFKLKHVFAYLGFMISLGVGLLLLYTYNDAFRARIVGETIYAYASGNATGQAVDVGGSGRVDFWVNGLKLWSDSDNALQYAFGHGLEAVQKNNYKMKGLPVFSHNQFVDALAQHGIVGLLLLLLYYYFMLRFILRRKRSTYFKLAMAMYAGTLIFAFFQSEIYFYYAILFALTLALLNINESNHQLTVS